MLSQSNLSIDSKFIVGIDVGGTKVHVLDTLSNKLQRFSTGDYQNLYDILDEYFTKANALPSHVAVAMAGPRDDATGSVVMTNFPWPAFNPHEAANRYPGVTFKTANDMVAAMAGALNISSMDLKQLKEGRASDIGTKVTVALSTGVNTCVAVWDDHSKKRVFLEAEAGHMGFQPNTEAQERHLKHLRTKYDQPSAELAISGKHGIESWIDHSPEMADAPELMQAVQRARSDVRPVGAVLHEFATEGQGVSKSSAHAILDNMGSTVANVLADYALVYKATGGIYLVGSVALALGEYWSENTSFVSSFTRKGNPDHAPWLESFLANIPIYLVTDPNIGVVGALSLAKSM